MVGYGPGIFFATRTRAWMWADRGVLSSTADGGATWRKRSDVVSPDVTEIGSASFVSETRGDALLYKNGRIELIHSRDGGTAWTSVHTWRPAA